RLLEPEWLNDAQHVVGGDLADRQPADLRLGIERQISAPPLGVLGAPLGRVRLVIAVDGVGDGHHPRRFQRGGGASLLPLARRIAALGDGGSVLLRDLAGAAARIHLVGADRMLVAIAAATGKAIAGLALAADTNVEVIAKRVLAGDAGTNPMFDLTGGKSLLRVLHRGALPGALIWPT